MCYHTHTLPPSLEHNKRVSSRPQGWVIASTGAEPLRAMRAAGGGAAVMVVAQWAGSKEVLEGGRGREFWARP